jgi:hypothetical protein
MHGAWHSPNRLTAMIHGQTFQMIALINRSLCILLLVAGWEPSSVQGQFVDHVELVLVQYMHEIRTTEC